MIMMIMTTFLWIFCLFPGFQFVHDESMPRPPRFDRNPRFNWVFSPKIRGGGFTPKWMVNMFMANVKRDDLGGKNPIFGNTHLQVPTS